MNREETTALLIEASKLCALFGAETNKSKDQGFGLPVVKRMTESLGGAVSFERQEGKGKVHRGFAITKSLSALSETSTVTSGKH